MKGWNRASDPVGAPAANEEESMIGAGRTQAVFFFNKPHDNYLYLITVHGVIRGNQKEHK